MAGVWREVYTPALMVTTFCGTDYFPFSLGKNLDALARELKLKTNGKQMLAALEKAGLI